ncbi:DUF4333 domain-containing protein [Mycolicibacterium sediminis]|uniref:DUF4333 domain-containing protein n=1 Tax=Mycolicibacterium sediminis TaxID=1286180 RepID=A0A7I7QUD5_9MYCO|nr:DUF4333 domain-containing protein [Mycolicibacterium sediminis]BBY29630.1 hypothetical protein MSEDJ_37260 [Mycolicibacterium sediminis]
MTRTLGMRVGAGLFAGAAALSMAACGDSTITPEGAAKSIVDLVSKQTKFTPADVTCPSGVKAEVGVEFDCGFTGPENTPYTAHMKILKVEGENVTFDINTEPTP